MDQNLLIGLIVVAFVGFAVYSYFPRLRSSFGGGLPGFEGFADASGKKVKGMKTPGPNGSAGGLAMDTTGPAATSAPAASTTPAKGSEHFSDYASFSGNAGMGPVPLSGGQQPAGCFPREQLNPSELLPADPNSQWAQVNPTGSGDLQGKSFLSAGALIGVNSIGQSMRNSNLQLRAEIPNPQIPGLTPFNNSTISPDLVRKDVFAL